uniref:Orn/DAP/Arg decarboxylase 2 N-terminal domain-containing protein n=1 Tax=Phlebotomus papatasi TaxID=29031 RepID=A0A1B0D759_PHLPP
MILKCGIHNVRNHANVTAGFSRKSSSNVKQEKAYAPIGDKFGCDPELESRQLLTKAKNLGLSVIGISFHVGSGCEDPPSFRKAIAGY